MHTAPIVIKGKSVSAIARYPNDKYRLFRTTPSGAAEAIPFQIDEINDDGDYVLDQGQDVTKNTGNGIFDVQDELSFMGDDVGPALEPTSWPSLKPNIVYEISVTFPGTNPMGPNLGAVYVGIYFGAIPELSPRNYVVFNRAQALVHTSRYKYQFDSRNWLVAKSVEVAKADTNPIEYEPVLDSTTFYMKGDLRYFITVEVNHRSIDSELEAWRSGPIRSLIRVSFFYKVLKLKIQLDMYTEISFFSNAVYLPAIIYNPIDGRKSLNPGSSMYYGLSLRENPQSFAVETNMDPAPIDTSSQLLNSGRSFLNKFMGKTQDKKASQGLYWLSAQGKGKSIYLEITPSSALQQEGVAPTIYKEDVSAADMKNRSNDDVSPLGKSPVNLGVAFDITRFAEGEHVMGFRLFFENVVAPERLSVFKSLGDWRYSARRVQNSSSGGKK
ncbi:MAG: hypothetical protein NT027_12460 [Proteobacteria bacterium]|nr:hypothetical protein [Pseudomonadota bacterium]